MKKISIVSLVLVICFLLVSCSDNSFVKELEQLHDKVFAVPTGTIADELVLSRFPDAQFQYYNSVMDAAMAVSVGRADAVAYDEPILRNIAAKNRGLKVLPEMITYDHYGFAVKLGNNELKETIDLVLKEIKESGRYEEMLQRWLPDQGAPGPMPSFDITGTDGVLTFGTSAVTEPFAYIDGSQTVVGFDIELAYLIAEKLNKDLVILNLDFGALIPSLASDRVDFVGALMTISEERKERVLFSEPYYIGGIAALVRYQENE